MGNESLKLTFTKLFFKYFGFYYEWLMTAHYEMAIRKEFLQFVSPKKEDTLIEFGCGPGNFLETVAPYCRIVYGLDASRQMLKRAEKKLKHAGINNVELIHSSMESFQPANLCDWAVGVVFVYQFQNPLEVLRKMMECVCPGGCVATMDPTVEFTRSNVKNFISKNKLSLKEQFVLKDWLRAAKFYHRFSDQELKKLYADAGLGSIELVHALNGMVIFAKGKRPISSV